MRQYRNSFKIANDGHETDGNMENLFFFGSVGFETTNPMPLHQFFAKVTRSERDSEKNPSHFVNKSDPPWLQERPAADSLLFRCPRPRGRSKRYYPLRGEGGFFCPPLSPSDSLSLLEVGDALIKSFRLYGAEMRFVFRRRIL